MSDIKALQQAVGVWQQQACGSWCTGAGTTTAAVGSTVAVADSTVTCEAGLHRPPLHPYAATCYLPPFMTQQQQVHLRSPTVLRQGLGVESPRLVRLCCADSSDAGADGAFCWTGAGPAVTAPDTDSQAHGSRSEGCVVTCGTALPFDHCKFTSHMQECHCQQRQHRINCVVILRCHTTVNHPVITRTASLSDRVRGVDMAAYGSEETHER